MHPCRWRAPSWLPRRWVWWSTPSAAARRPRHASWRQRWAAWERSTSSATAAWRCRWVLLRCIRKEGKFLVCKRPAARGTCSGWDGGLGGASTIRGPTTHACPHPAAATPPPRWRCRWPWASRWRTACAAACLTRCCTATRCSSTRSRRGRWWRGWARTSRCCRCEAAGGRGSGVVGVVRGHKWQCGGVGAGAESRCRRRSGGAQAVKKPRGVLVADCCRRCWCREPPVCSRHLECAEGGNSAACKPPQLCLPCAFPQTPSRPAHRHPPPQGTVAKLLGARGIRSAFETTGIILVLFSLSWPLAVALLVTAPLLTPLIAQLGRRIGAASKASQVRRPAALGWQGICGCLEARLAAWHPGARLLHLRLTAQCLLLGAAPTPACRQPPTTCPRRPTRLWRTCAWSSCLRSSSASCSALAGCWRPPTSCRSRWVGLDRAQQGGVEGRLRSLLCIYFATRVTPPQEALSEGPLCKPANLLLPLPPPRRPAGAAPAGAAGREQPGAQHAVRAVHAGPGRLDGAQQQRDPGHLLLLLRVQLQVRAAACLLLGSFSSSMWVGWVDCTGAASSLHACTDVP